MVPIVLVAVQVRLTMVNGATVDVDFVVVVIVDVVDVVDVVVEVVVVVNFVVLTLLDVADLILFSCGKKMLI